MNRHGFMRKIIGFSLAVCVAAVGLPFAAMADSEVKSEESVYLSDLGVAGYRNNSDEQLKLDKNYSGDKITVGGTAYDKGICLMPGSNFAAQAHYDLTGKTADKFTAVVGREASAAAGSAVAYVYGDGKELFKSGALTAGSKENISVSVAGVIDLWLVVEDGGDGNTGDQIAFADAMITNVTESSERGSVALSSLVYSDFEGEKISVNTTPDSENLAIGSRPMESGVYMQPSASSASVSYDISTIGADSFKTYVGKEASAADGGKGHLAQYTVYVDGKVAAQSRQLDYGEYCVLSADIAGDATTLKLEVTALDGADYDYCVFGNAKLYFDLPGTGYVDMQNISMPSAIVDDLNPLSTSNIKIGSKTYTKGYMAYPENEGTKGYVSELSFDVSGLNAKTFKSTIGLNSTANTNGVYFAVYADGQSVYKSDIVTGATAATDITADITGANLVTLTVNCNGNNTNDYAIWAEPKVMLDADTATHMTGYRKMSLTELTWTSAVSESKNPVINGPYQTGADYLIKVADIEYKYGISAHPYSNETPSTITYDLTGWDAKYFTVKVGKTQEKGISSYDQNLKEQFLIYCDGSLKTQSEPITIGHYTELAVDVTGVKTLTIAIDACGNYGWGACAWCEPTLYCDYQPGSINVTSPVSESEKHVSGKQSLNITGTANSVSSLKCTLNDRVIGTFYPNGEGFFDYKITSLLIKDGKNNVSVKAYVGDTETAEYTFVLIRKNTVSVMDCNWLRVTENGGVTKNGAINALGYGYLSIGGMTHLSKEGYAITPAGGTFNLEEQTGYCDVVIDVSAASLGSNVTYFHSLVGLDDYAHVDNGSKVGGSVQFYLLSNSEFILDPVIASTRVMNANEVATLACEIPGGTTELTMRVTNVDGNSYMDASDWIEPTLYMSAEDYGTVEKNLYSVNNLGGNTTVNAETSVGQHFAPTTNFNTITMNPVNASDETLTASLYKFTYSYKRSLQNGALCTVTAKEDGEGKYAFELGDDYAAGEYVFVVDGITEIAANGSQYGTYYCDGTAAQGILDMSVTFAGKLDSYLNIPTSEPVVVADQNNASAAEKARAKETYENMTTDLANFPCTMTIGEVSYNGFGSDFTLENKETTTSDTFHSETTKFTIKHKDGLTFILTSVFYPDYAAFDWVIYFTNETDKNSAIVSNLNPAELDFEGENPVIHSNYGDEMLPYMPQHIELQENQSYDFASSTGRSTEGSFPYYNFEYGNQGAVMAVSWAGVWGSSFQYADGNTHFTDTQKNFSSYVVPGEVLRTPLTAVILYDGRDTERATNLWRRWFLDCNMNRYDDQNVIDPFIAGVTSGLFSEMENATDDNQIECMQKYIENGIDLDVWWMDAGWYTDETTPRGWSQVGNWTPNTERFPSKMSAISDYANDNDVKTLLWFEPERCGIYMREFDETNEAQVKKEWLIGYNAETNTAYGVDGVYELDLGNEECLTWLKNQIATVLTEGGISMYREDLNMTLMGGIWDGKNAEDVQRSGVCENKCVQGHYELWDSILALDNVDLIDSCASGGHRLDLESMRRAVALHPTDYDYNDTTAKQIATYYLNSWFPFAGANTGSDYTHVDKYIMRSAYREALILQFDSRNLSASDWTLLNACVDEWQKIQPYFYGDLYELTHYSVSENQWYSYSYLDRTTTDGFAMVFRRSGDDAPSDQNIKLKGLDPSSMYEITFADSTETYTGSGLEFMGTGVPVTLDTAKSSEIIYIKCTQLASVDKTALENTVKKAEGTQLTGYTDVSVNKLVTALYAAKCVMAEELCNTLDVQTANDNLNAAISGLAKAGTLPAKDAAVAELNNFINSIGEINADNYTLKLILIERAEAFKASVLSNYGSSTVVDSADALIAARKAYNALAGVADTVTYGDVTGDGLVDSADALAVLQFTVNKKEFTEDQKKAGDVNADGVVDSADALNILQKKVGKLDKFKAEQ